jgi:FtsH-binding integral membrane protein
MTPKRFLNTASVVLLTIGALGVTRRLGSMSRASFFNPPYWINWFHLLLGGFVVAVRRSHSSTLQTATALVAAIMGTTLGLLGLVLGPSAARRFGVPELADPSDHVAHLTVGLLALWGWQNREPHAD